MPAEVVNVPLPSPSPPPPGATESSLLPPAARDPNLCANCDQPLHGPFCSHCGQHVRDLHRSVWRFVLDFIDNVLSWDSKVFRTLQPLLTQPGAVTLDYLSGRRVRYVHPLRLFLFTSAICLTIIQYFGGSPVLTNVNTDAQDKKHQRGLNFQFGSPSPTASPAAGASPAPAATPAATAAPSPSPPASREGENDDDPPVTKDVADVLNRAAEQVRQASAAAADHARPPGASPALDEDFGDRIARKVEKRLKEPGGSQRMQKEITADVQRRISWVALALLPIFAMMLRGLYWRRDSYYFAHFVFSLHYHTFLLLFLATYTLLGLVLPTSFWPVHTLLRLCLLLPGGYLFIALRRLYGEGGRRTFAKVCVLGVMHLSVLCLGLTIVGGWAAYRALG